MQTFSTFTATKVFDKRTGMVKGVSVINIGPALGHGTNVDEKSLATVMQAANAHPDGVKVHIQHDSDLKDLVGFLNNFKIDGDHVRADLKLVKMSPWFGYLSELIETNPSAFGLSISFDGSEEIVDDESYIRVDNLFSVDLVSNPAANASGLFSSRVIKGRTRMSTEAAEAAKVALDTDADGDVDNDLASRVGLLEQGFAELKSVFDKMMDSANSDDKSGDGDDDDEENAEDSESDESDDYKAEVAELKAQLAKVNAELEAVKAKETSVSKLAARKLAATGVKSDKRVKVSVESTPNIREQFEALKSVNDRVNFYRKHRKELKELQGELVKENLSAAK